MGKQVAFINLKIQNYANVTKMGACWMRPKRRRRMDRKMLFDLLDLKEESLSLDTRTTGKRSDITNRRFDHIKFNRVGSNKSASSRTSSGGPGGRGPWSSSSDTLENMVMQIPTLISGPNDRNEMLLEEFDPGKPKNYDVDVLCCFL